MRALSFFGRPSAAKQERMRAEERRGEGRHRHGVCVHRRPSCLGRSACRVSPSSHAQALSPRSSPSSLHLFLRSRRLLALLLLPTFICAVVFTQDLIYRCAQCISLRYADPIPLAIALALALEAPPAASVSHAAISGSHSIRQRGKVKPSATCHRPPTPLYSRASLNLVAAVSTSSLPAAVRPFDPKTRQHAVPPVSAGASLLFRPCYPASPQTPSRIQSDGAPICGTDAHDITPVARFCLQFYRRPAVQSVCAATTTSTCKPD